MNKEDCPTRSAQACQSLAEIRVEIDRLDQRLVPLLIERAQYVAKAAEFKPSYQHVRLPDRVEEVVQNALSCVQRHLEMDPFDFEQSEALELELIERIYRSMVDAYIAYEGKHYRRKKSL